MAAHKTIKMRQAIFLFLALYVLSFAGFFGLRVLSDESSGAFGLSRMDFLLAAFLPFIVLAYPIYHVFFL